MSTKVDNHLSKWCHWFVHGFVMSMDMVCSSGSQDARMNDEDELRLSSRPARATFVDPPANIHNEIILTSTFILLPCGHHSDHSSHLPKHVVLARDLQATRIIFERTLALPHTVICDKILGASRNALCNNPIWGVAGKRRVESSG